MRLAVAIPLLALAVLYARGWLTLRRRGRASMSWMRLAFAALASVAVTVALSTPLDQLAHELFAAHMAQHLVLVSVGAPAIVLADPFALALWGVPRRWRRPLGRIFAPRHTGRRLLALVTLPPIAWLVHTFVVWVWHVPAFYDAAVVGRVLHDLEHVCFFAAAVLYWWPVIAPAPRVRRPAAPVVAIAYLLLGAFQSSTLGVWLMTRPEPLYAVYGAGALARGLTPLEDQALGGAIMWIVAGAVDMTAVLVVLFRFFGASTARAMPRSLTRLDACVTIDRFHDR